MFTSIYLFILVGSRVQQTIHALLNAVEIQPPTISLAIKLWIHVCITRKKVYCHYCLQWYKRGVLSFTKKYDSAFILDGFQNWKKGHELLE